MKIDTVRSAESIETWLMDEMSKVSGLDPRALSAHDPFSRCGLDSVGIVSLLARLGLAIGSAVPPTLAWEYPTPAALARFLSGTRPAAVPEVAKESLHRASAEPIAVVGMACRFPRSPSIAAFWQLLCEGRDAITEVPRERWDASAFYDPDPAAPGKMNTRWGGFIDGVAGFDPLFFGISPREARQMDPQQRLILQLAWEALEDANLRPSTLVGTRTGVYIGVIWSDYAKLLYQSGAHAIDPYTVTGHHYSLIANRVSYHLGLQGPSLALDTACSSSLVAVHLACESLRRGESVVALAGGVNLMLAVQSAIGTAKLGVLSPGSRCYAFDQRANGTVRGEGGGVVVLKRLSQALRDGDDISCVLRASAVNNDGASNGLSAPNPLAQQALLRKAYAEAGIEPAAVQYVEAHGTGTLLGDPIEAGALGTILSARRPSDQPLLIGSVKTNIGHLEGAAGIAGLIKVALCLRNRQIPPSLNFEIPNSLIPFAALRLEVAQALRGWPRPDRPLIGGISSFGLGGTNCHLVMQESTPPRPELLTLSANSPEALVLTADRVLSGLTAPSAPLSLGSLCGFMATHLSDGAYRVAVTGRSLTELQQRLQDFLAERSAPGLAVGLRPAGSAPRLAFVFSGQGAQWFGMGRVLLASEPVFRAKLMECDRLVQQNLGWSLLTELTSEKEVSRLDRIDVSLPAIISLEIATAALWRSWGIEPDAVVGHSTGEIAAAHVAGALSLADTMRVICAYGRVIYQRQGQGAMGVVALSWAEAATALVGYEGKVYRAIQHSTDSTVLAGEPAALSEVFAALRQREIYCQQVRMDVAPHCPLVDSLRAELLAAVQEIRPRPTSVPLVSEVTGSWFLGEHLDAAHWVRNFAEPAYFATAIDTLLEADCSLFLDVSPQPIVRHAIEANLRHADRAGAVLASLRRADDERGALLETLGALYARGFNPHWAAVHPALPEALRRHHQECFTEALSVSGALRAEHQSARGEPPAGTASSSPLCLPLSAKNAAALRAQAGQYAKHLAEHAEQSLHDIAFTASTRRDHHAHRLAVVSDSREEVLAALVAYSRGELPPKVFASPTPAMARPKVVFVFPGLGSQWLGMGRTLLAAEEVFRDALEDCDRVIQEVAGFSVVHELLAEETSSRLELHEVIQPVMFSLQIALAALWRSWGIEPDAIVGHSMGEIAGAQVAGALSLRDAALVICSRSRLGQKVQQPGAMMLVELPPHEAEAAIQGFADRVSIAAYNAPRATVLAGAPAALDELAVLLQHREVFIRRIKVAVAAHSPQLDPVLPELREQLKGVQAKAAQLALYSTVTEQRVEGRELDADYWVKNFRLPVLFSQTIQRLIDDGFQIFLELSPHPILLPSIAENLQAKQSPGVALGSLRRSVAARQCLLESLSGLYTHGYPVDFGRIYAHGGRAVTLPSYPWQNERYWVELLADPPPLTPAAAQGEAAEQSEQEDPLAQCLYQVDWLLAPHAVATPLSPLSILLFSDSAGSADSVISSLSSLPIRFIKVFPASDFRRSSADSFLINPLDPEHYRRLLHLCFPDTAPCSAAWHLWSLDCSSSPCSADSAGSLSPVVACASAAFLVQALLRHGWRDLPSLLLCTRGAVPMAEPLSPQSPIALSQAPLWGLGRSLSLEHPELPCKLIDLSPAPLSPELLCAELLTQDTESQVALRSSGRYLARFAPGRWSVNPGHVAPFAAAGPWVRPEASYLITGGLSGLGLRLAQDLVASGVRHLVLVSRSQPSAQAAELIGLWRQRGVQVLASATDVADAEQLDRLFAIVDSDFPPLRGIVHCAAVLDDHAVLQLSTESFARTFVPKVQGAWLLHSRSLRLQLDFFLLYSCTASSIGSPGQANYAAANAFLDALAHERVRLGLPAISIQWGRFSSVGLAASLDQQSRRSAYQGLDSLSPEEGLTALVRLLGSPRPQATVVRLNLRQWIQYHPQLAASRYFANLPKPSSARAPDKAQSQRLLQSLSAVPLAARRRLLEQHLSELFSQVLQLPASQLQPGRSFSEYGVDSLMRLELRNRLEASLDLKLSATLLFTYPTLSALADFLLTLLTPQAVPVSPASVVVGAVQPADTNEPIAVVGIACRLPGGACSPSSLWDNLLSSRDPIVKIPPHRWPLDALPERLRNSGWAGLVDDIDCFDADFFSISPREASALDPQQRLLLELSWEALEAAGQPQDLLVGSRTGVFVGMTSMDYHTLTLDKEIEQLGAHDMIGTVNCTAAGRVSYWFGLQGPCMVVDTACSSSLVALHLACQSLRSGESSLALAAGVNALLSPKIMALMAATNTLSPDSRCKTFDASANGLVRSEGGAVVVLKRLSDALKNHDPIVCLIRGSAVNQDGRSSDLTAPNVLSQQLLLRQALASAHLSAQDIGLVETHGTGTSLGDPIEVEALKAVYGGPRADQTHCYLGALKSNLGHLEAASGIAGLIKAALCLSKEAIPKNLHFKTLNPRISLDQTPLVIPTTTIPWPAGPKPRRAGVSAFGIGGTNAHMIVEEAPRRSVPAAAQHSSYLVPLSAKSPQSLLAMAKSYAEYLSRSDESLHDIAYTASVRRVQHEHRLACIGRTAAEVAAMLAAYARRESAPGLCQSQVAARQPPKVVFVFPGQGSQWLGMGRTLLRQEPVFREAINRCDQVIRELAEFSVLAELDADEQHSRLDRQDVVQPLLFSLQVALAALWRSWSIEPDAVLGHSMGEVAAACVAGALSLETAALIVCTRSRLAQRVRGLGAMLLVELTKEQAEQLIAGQEAALSVAACNGPRSTVLSGATAAVEQAAEQLRQRGVFHRRIQVEYASHSPQMDLLMEDLCTALREVRPEAAKVYMRSTVSAEVVLGPELTATYWAENLRRPVLFAQAAQQLLSEGFTVFLEISPHPILLPSIQESLNEQSVSGGSVLPSLHRQTDERSSLLETLGALYVLGCAVDWPRLYEQGGRTVPLPSYRWHHERYWLPAPAAPAASRPTGQPSLPNSGVHPTLGIPISVASQPEKHLWQNQISLSSHPFLTDHRVGSEAVFPAAAYLEMAIAAALQVWPESAVTLTDVAFESFLALPPEQSLVVQFDLTDEGAGAARFQVAARGTTEPGWHQHASGRLSAALLETEPPAPVSLAELRGRLCKPVELDKFYSSMQRAGLHYGPAFQGLQQVWTGEREALAWICLPASVRAGDAYLIHPALLDACGQLPLALVSGSTVKQTSIYVPVALAELRVLRLPPSQVWAHVRAPGLEADPPANLLCDVTLFDEDGAPCVLLTGVHLVKRDSAALQTEDKLAQCIYQVDWLAAAHAEAAPVSPLTIVLFSDAAGSADAVVASLESIPVRFIRVFPNAEFRRCSADSFVINPREPEHYHRLLRQCFPEAAPCAAAWHLWSLDSSSAEASEDTAGCLEPAVACASAAFLAQALLCHGWRDLPSLVLLTRGAVPVAEPLSTKAPRGLFQAPLWGLGRSLSLEHPELPCKLIDLSPEPLDAEILRAELLTQDLECQVAVRTGGRYLARFAPGSWSSAGGTGARSSGAEPWVKPEASYLITGGLSGLGLSLAQELVERGARHLVLISRSPPGAQAAEMMEQWRSRGVQVMASATDVAEAEQLARLFAEVERVFPPLRGIVHCAAVLDDHAVLQLSGESFARTFAPKVQGAWLLHRLSLHLQLDFFVLYSSAASVLGAPGQANYAAANAFLDALAHERVRLGLPAISIQWGRFSSVGLAASLEQQGRRSAYQGLDSLSPEEGLAALVRLLGSPRPQATVVRLNLRQWIQYYPQLAASRYFANLPKPSSARAPDKAQSQRLLQSLSAVPLAARRRLLEQHLSELFSQVLQLPASRLQSGRSFSEYGVDSLMRLELRNRLEASLGFKLSVSLLFTYPTLSSLADFLLTLIAPPKESQPSAKPAAGQLTAALPRGNEPTDDDEYLAAIDESIRRLEEET